MLISKPYLGPQVFDSRPVLNVCLKVSGLLDGFCEIVSLVPVRWLVWFQWSAGDADLCVPSVWPSLPGGVPEAGDAPAGLQLQEAQGEANLP